MASCSALKAISSAVSWILGMVVWADIVMIDMLFGLTLRILIVG